ncbi:MAG: protein kinase [Planctomycetota bacterium]
MSDTTSSGPASGGPVDPRGPTHADATGGAAPREVELRPGDALGPYRIEGELGRGGMGVVYRVRHPELGPLALKLILTTRASPVELERFAREAEALARVQHPHVVRVHQLGRAAQGPYLVTELVEGETLQAALRRGPLEPERAARLMLRLCAAVEAVHAVGLLHRDLKPANVILRASPAAGATPELDDPVLLDFGVVQDEGAERLTQTGQLVGTPSTMSPEQANGERAAFGPATDVYGLGVLLYAALEGQGPFEGRGGLVAAIRAVLTEPPPWPSRANLPPTLVAIAERALAKEPGERYPDAGALARDLERFLAGEQTAAQPARRRWTGPAGLALAAALSLSVAGGLLTRSLRARDDERDLAPVVAALGDPTAPGFGEHLEQLLAREPELAPRLAGARALARSFERLEPQLRRDLRAGRPVDVLTRTRAWRGELAAPAELERPLTTQLLAWCDQQERAAYEKLSAEVDALLSQRATDALDLALLARSCGESFAWQRALAAEPAWRERLATLRRRTVALAALAPPAWSRVLARGPRGQLTGPGDSDAPQVFELGSGSPPAVLLVARWDEWHKWGPRPGTFPQAALRLEWTLAAGEAEQPPVPLGPAFATLAAARAPDGAVWIVGTDPQGAVSARALPDDLRQIALPRGKDPIQGLPRALAVGPAGQWLAVGYGDGRVLLVDLHATGAPRELRPETPLPTVPEAPPFSSVAALALWRDPRQRLLLAAVGGRRLGMASSQHAIGRPGDPYVGVWDLAGARELVDFAAPARAAERRLAFHNEPLSVEPTDAGDAVFVGTARTQNLVRCALEPEELRYLQDPVSLEPAAGSGRDQELKRAATPPWTPDDLSPRGVIRLPERAGLLAYGNTRVGAEARGSIPYATQVRIFRADTLEPWLRQRRYPARTTCLTLSRDGRFLISCHARPDTQDRRGPLVVEVRQLLP